MRLHCQHSGLCVAQWVRLFSLTPRAHVTKARSERIRDRKRDIQTFVCVTVETLVLTDLSWVHVDVCRCTVRPHNPRMFRCSQTHISSHFNWDAFGSFIRHSHLPIVRRKGGWETTRGHFTVSWSLPCCVNVRNSRKMHWAHASSDRLCYFEGKVWGGGARVKERNSTQKSHHSLKQDSQKEEKETCNSTSC